MTECEDQHFKKEGRLPKADMAMSSFKILDYDRKGRNDRIQKELGSGRSPNTIQRNCTTYWSNENGS